MDMEKMNVINRMYEAGALAIIRTEILDRACEITEGCMKDGVLIMEMSHALDNVGDIIQGLSEKYRDAFCVGARTALDAETTQHAILHSAALIIALNYNEEVVEVCNCYRVPYVPGCTTVTECVDALSNGAAFIKAFPVSDSYGPELVKVFKTPIPDIPVLTSGRINLNSLIMWLENGVDVCGFGELLTRGSSEDIAINAAKIHEIITSSRCSK